MKIQNTFLLQSLFSPAKIFLFLILTVSLLFSSAYSADVTLQWDPNTEPDIAGYKIYYDTNTSAPYEGIDADQGASPIIVAIGNLADANHPGYTITGLEGSRDYFFAVTAYDNETPSLESDYSDEVSVSTYTIGSSAGSNGAVSPSGSVSVTHGSSQTFTITPNTGYHIGNVLVDGSSAGAVSSYTFSSITTNHTISASFAINSYTITASSGASGTISPSGSVSVTHGSSQTFTITPNTGYHIADVLVDGSSVGTVSSYTFSSITANHTLSASFAVNSYTITASSGSNGAISPSGSVSATQGSNQTFTITPNTGYHIGNVLVDGSSAGAVSSYTFTSITANHTLSASFTINSYTITASAGANGTISPSGSVSVTQGSSQTFTIAPNAGYHIADVLVDGSSVGTVSSYTFSSITTNHTLSASFAVSSYTITASSGSNGAVSPSGSVSVTQGSSQTFTITPNAGYHIADVLVDGSSVGTVSSYTFTNIMANHTISASFEAENQPPAANAGPDQLVDEKTIVTLSGSNSTDPDDGIAGFSWIQTQGTPVVLSNPNEEETTFTAPDVLPAGEALVFQVTVEDYSGVQTTDTCIVNVSWVNIPPVASAGSDQTVYERDTIVLDASNSSDSDDGVASFQWTQTEGVPVSLSDSQAIRPTFIAPDAGPDGISLTFSLIVTDQGGLQSTDTCIISVTWTNMPPTADSGLDQEANEGETVVLNGSNSFDEDDGIASYQWVQTYGTPVTLSDPTSDQPTFQAPNTDVDGESLRFQLTVTDNSGLQAQDVCIVNISPIDYCPDDPNKVDPGECGCGISDVDTDNDGTPDCIDSCPNDPNKTEPGVNGCNETEPSPVTDSSVSETEAEQETPIPDNGTNNDILPDDDQAVITSSQPDIDNTRIPDDRNGDGIPDRDQANVTSLQLNNDQDYVTIESPEGTVLQGHNTSAITSEMFPSSEDIEFPSGFFEFTVSGVLSDGSITVILTLPKGRNVDTYYKFGKTPDNPVDHWYEFLYDGETGAEINGNVITLHFVDGRRGDDDLDSSNGIIVDPGGPALINAIDQATETAGGDTGGGGCFIGSFIN